MNSFKRFCKKNNILNNKVVFRLAVAPGLVLEGVALSLIAHKSDLAMLYPSFITGPIQAALMIGTDIVSSATASFADVELVNKVHQRQLSVRWDCLCIMQDDLNVYYGTRKKYCDKWKK